MSLADSSRPTVGVMHTVHHNIDHAFSTTAVQYSRRINPIAALSTIKR